MKLISVSDYTNIICGGYQEKFEDIIDFIPTSTPNVSLQLICKFSQGYKSIFEIGSWIGRSAKAFSQNFSIVKTIDFSSASDINYQYNGYSPCELARDLANVDFLEINSREYSDFSEKFDCVYVDGNHSYDGCKHDLGLARKLCKVGGLVFIDDYFNRVMGVKKAVDEVIGEDLTHIVGTDLVYFECKG